MSQFPLKTDPAKIDRVTRIIIWGCIALWIIWDVYVAVSGNTTESRFLANWSVDSVALPWSMGMLLGHWYWLWRNSKVPAATWRTVLNFSFLGLLLLWDFATYKYGWTKGYGIRYPGIWPVIGYPMGHFLWGQKEKTNG